MRNSRALSRESAVTLSGIAIGVGFLALRSTGIVGDAIASAALGVGVAVFATGTAWRGFALRNR